MKYVLDTGETFINANKDPEFSVLNLKYCTRAVIFCDPKI